MGIFISSTAFPGSFMWKTKKQEALKKSRMIVADLLHGLLYPLWTVWDLETAVFPIRRGHEEGRERSFTCRAMQVTGHDVHDQRPKRA